MNEKPSAGEPCTLTGGKTFPYFSFVLVGMDRATDEVPRDMITLSLNVNNPELAEHKPERILDELIRVARVAVREHLGDVAWIPSEGLRNMMFPTNTKIVWEALERIGVINLWITHQSASNITDMHGKPLPHPL